jgi:DNA polymerase-1
MTNSDRPLFLIVDGYSLAFRAYYAFAKAKKGPLTTSTGIPTSVCFGFLNSLFAVINEIQPQFIAIAFDLKQATFRHQADDNYKADRPEAPTDFIEDVSNLKKLLTALNINMVTAQGYEADDVIGTLATQAVQQNYSVRILSGDRDLFQLVNDDTNVQVLYLGRNFGKYEVYDEEAVFAKMKVKPTQIVDFKALCGDKSDCIPGVLGIGEKIASNLLAEYPTLTNVYDNLDNLKTGIKNKLIKGKDEAFHSQFLAKIITDIDLQNNLQDYQFTTINHPETLSFLKTLELKKLVNQINKIQVKLGGKLLPELNEEQQLKTSAQLSLFSIPENEITLQPLIVDHLDKLSQLIKHIQQAKITAWDTETDALDTQTANLIGIGCCWGNSPEQVAYIPVQHKQGKQLSLEQIQAQLNPILAEPKYPKTFHHAKFDRLILINHGFDLQGVIFDTLLASYVLQPETSHKLSTLSQQYKLTAIAQDYDSLNIEKEKTIADLPIEKVANYCGLDVLSTWQLTEKLQLELELANNTDLQQVFELELKLEPILAKMENIGVLIDKEYLEKLSKILTVELEQIEKQTYQEYGEFNLASPKQLSTLLFDQLGLDKRQSKKTKTGYSTNQTVLEKLVGDHPIIEQILRHRTLAKLKSTYVDALPNLINPKTKRIHTNYNQTVTATGRLSSSNPNLQNIPIRTEFSRQIRQAFITKPNWQFLSADYSQIELRILAHLSEEPILVSAYQNNQDIHTVTAQIVLEKEEISPEERNLGKTINFGIIYGMGAQKFAREVKVSVKQAQEFIEIYKEKYAQVFQYLETVKKQALINGYVTTILGRRRYFDFDKKELDKINSLDINHLELSAINFNYQTAQLLRAAANAPIQGSSADIIKLAMVEIDKILTKYQGNLLLQVHDELVLELPSTEIEELSIKVKEAMENVIQLKIPLLVDIHTGNNWMEAK